MSKRASMEEVELFQGGPRKALHPIKIITSPQEGQAVDLPVADIRPDPNQPRKVFSKESIASLANSILDKGLFQPISVRPDPERTDGFIVVMGERRWRAHQHAGLPTIRAFIIPVDDPNEAFELALIENVQREDLNPLEEAEGVAELIKRRGYKQKEVARVICRSEPHVSQLMKLTRIPTEVKEKLLTSKLSQDHLFRIAEQPTPESMLRLFNRVVRAGLNVRETRKAAKEEALPPKQHPLVHTFKRIEKTITQARIDGLNQLAGEDRKQVTEILETIRVQIEQAQQQLSESSKGQQKLST